MISWVTAALLGLMSCCAASTIVRLGTTVGNHITEQTIDRIRICRVDPLTLRDAFRLQSLCRLFASRW